MTSWQARHNGIGRVAAVALAVVWAPLMLLSGVGCYASHPLDRADTNTSWLLCRVQADCSDGYTCTRGWCVPDAAPQSVAPTQLSLHAELLRDAPFVLSDTERRPGPPTVRWVGDHWLGAWWSVNIADLRVEVKNIAADGNVQAHHQQAALRTRWPPNAMITEDGRLALLRANDGCSLEVFDNAGEISDDSFAVPCGEHSRTATATPVPGSSDWLIAYATDGPDGGEFVAGRYRPDAQAWSVPPITLGTRSQYATLDVFTMDEDALIVSGDRDGTNMVTVPKLARPSMQPTDSFLPQPLGHLGVDVIGSDKGFGFAPAGARKLALGTDGTQLWVAPLRYRAEPSMVRELAPPGMVHRRPGVAPVPELGITGVCFAIGTGTANTVHDQSDRISFMLLDKQGMPIGEPLVIADGLYSGGCDLAWSGESFLVAWWDIESTSDAAGYDGVVRANIVSLRD